LNETHADHLEELSAERGTTIVELEGAGDSSTERRVDSGCAAGGRVGGASI
jgi:hypothetical protein